MKRIFISILFLFASFADANNNYENKIATTANNDIDNIIEKAFVKNNISFANECSDSLFIRRVYIDLAGTIPTPDIVKEFIKNSNANKRSELIDQLLNSEDFVNYLTLKWCDILRVKAEFPINLWPNGVQAYHRWIYNSVKTNKNYYDFAYELLTSSGSNFKNPSVNFYRALQEKTPKGIATAVALTFMGLRFEKLNKIKQDELIKFFSNIKYKGTAEWKETIVYNDMRAPEISDAKFPDGVSINIPVQKDPRKYFTLWLLNSPNSTFKKNIVNRIWSWLLGYGIINEVDDICEENIEIIPELLAYLELELKKSNYDLKHIFRIILNSRTYQQSSIPKKDLSNSTELNLFASYQVRQLKAEVLVDVLNKIFGGLESYSSQIPEPFTFVPEEYRSVSLADGSISSQFLEMFGRPSRDTGLESERNNNSTETQRLHILNSSHIRNKILKSQNFKQSIRNIKNLKDKIEFIYLTILSRYPFENEIIIIKNLLHNGNIKYKNKKKRNKANFQKLYDLVWALINTKEFMFNH